MVGEQYYIQMYARCLELCPTMKPVISYIRATAGVRQYRVQAIFQNALDGDESAKQKLKEIYLRSALVIALTYAEDTGLPLDELFSEAAYAMYCTVDSNRAVSAKHFYLHIHNKMKRMLDSYVSEYGNGTAITVEDENTRRRYTRIDIQAVGYDGERTMLDRISNDELHDCLVKVCKLLLNENEQRVIAMRYGIDSDIYTFSEIAERFGMKPESVKHIRKYGLFRLSLSGSLMHFL